MSADRAGVDFVAPITDTDLALIVDSLPDGTPVAVVRGPLVLRTFVLAADAGQIPTSQSPKLGSGARPPVLGSDGLLYQSADIYLSWLGGTADNRANGGLWFIPADQNVPMTIDCNRLRSRGGVLYYVNQFGQVNATLIDARGIDTHA